MNQPLAKRSTRATVVRLRRKSAGGGPERASPPRRLERRFEGSRLVFRFPTDSRSRFPVAALTLAALSVSAASATACEPPTTLPPFPYSAAALERRTLAFLAICEKYGSMPVADSDAGLEQRFQRPTGFQKRRHREYYPVEARRAGIEGVVGLVVLVGQDGKVLEVAVVEQSKHQQLDAAAWQLYKDARFVPPPMLDGQPVPAILHVRVNFDLGP